MEHRYSTNGRRCWPVLLVFLLLAVGGSGDQVRAVDDPPAQAVTGEGASVQSDPGDATDCRKLAALLEQQKVHISRETGQIKREIAALRDDLSKPGIQEIFAGIGYIFGLAGIGLYVHARRSQSGRGGRKPG
jgi:hypothetical protein